MLCVVRVNLELSLMNAITLVVALRIKELSLGGVNWRSLCYFVGGFVYTLFIVQIITNKIIGLFPTFV